MTSRTIVIVGGVAGGASAAARLRRLNENDRIIMYERGEHISFANCGLPYYIGETITSREKLLIQSPAAMKNRFEIDVRTRTEVIRIDRERKQVHVRSAETGMEAAQPYDLLLLSPGARPIMPDIEGLREANNVFTLRNIPDTDRIKRYVDERKPGHATIVGGGFIGIEMAESLRERGMDVALLERNAQVLGPLDFEMAKAVERHVAQKGVKVVLNTAIAAVERAGTRIRLDSGKIMDTDMIIMAIGVEPENILAKEAGLELGVRGAIKVNEHLQTSDPAIYAVGDAIEVKDRINGFDTVVPLAWGANRQGRLAADHMNGREAVYRGAYGTAIVKVFDLTAAVTGSNEKTLRKLGIPFETIHIHPNSHAGYYPGAASIALKLLFDPSTGAILGAQAVGSEGVDKRLDVIATAIRAGLRAQDLADLELSYAPPYSSAKDPVNMAGYVASNVMEGLVRTMQWHEVDGFVAEGGLLIDVRDAVERDFGYIPGSVNIPVNDLRERLGELPKDKELVVSCQVGLRGYIAARMLAQHGFRVRNVDGGYKTYSAAMWKDEESASFPSNDSKRESAPVQVQPETQRPTKSVLVDACGMQCPGPIMKVYEAMAELGEGDLLEVKATDFGFSSDIKKWAEKSGHSLESLDTSSGVVHATIRKAKAAERRMTTGRQSETRDGTTMVVFSGDLDKAIASFIIASGAAAMGKSVTMFFTFWGLNVLRKPDAPSVRKSGLERMLGFMMPNSSKSLPMSKMNMAGMGPRMIRHVMKKKNVDSLEQLMDGAIRAGVKLVACTMSMDIMGIKREELMDGIEYGGVATFLGDAEDAGVNLFI
ncbi:DsrE/DsrF/DrsH-like family protein [Cohnella faecalis]|uniref:Pyridine nucleotide-disulfide oxidoreductase n=1 Tax=Cohnella faecalis TaxID=2315694 RepID=A0A398CRB3_9BACL|nr:DsrE/DsrF/DrsH-like family protein [Cohnella faecalis]RIE01454.1 pyridine nucleotide-disulfide oxidoreductase [Cohnella faecalis]